RGGSGHVFWAGECTAPRRGRDEKRAAGTVEGDCTAEPFHDARGIAPVDKPVGSKVDRQPRGTLPAPRLRRSCPRIHTHPQFEILTSRRASATASGVSAAQTRSGKMAPRDRGPPRLDFATTIEPAVILAVKRGVDPAMTSSVSWLD